MAEFRILGSVEVISEGESLELGTAKQRAVLAALLVDAETPVTADTLVDRIWDQSPPAGARRVVQAHISRIRSVLATVTRDTGDQAALQRTAGSYVLRVPNQRVDLHRARSLVRQARETNLSEAVRADRLREAVDCWRGEPLAGVDGDWFARIREGLARQRLEVLVEWADAELRLGHQAEVIELLRAPVADQPTHEPMVEQLMRALAAAGHPAEAMELYASTRTLLAEQLGASPGARLQATHMAILRDESPAPLVPAPAPVVVAHRGLPPDIAEFTGRSAEVAALAEACGSPSPTAPAMTAIVGTGGVGKTRLALHLAHRLRAAGQFEDGQIYLDLRGFTDAGDPADPRQALGELLRLLGVPAGDIPDGVASRSAVLRDRVAGRRVLLLLDNVADERQVESLLPGSPTCTVLMTARRTPAIDGVGVLDLDVFTEAEALELLSAVIGADRVSAELTAAGQLVRRCGLLPLAVAIAGRRLRARPAWPIAHLAARIAGDRGALDELSVGGRGVHAVLTQSYRRLDPAQQRTLRLLGRQPGDDWTARSAADLTGADVADTERILEHLLDHHLLHQRWPGHYRMRDLVRAFAVQAR
jgi:DNA-binding SARP family transcriptional activator